MRGSATTLFICSLVGCAAATVPPLVVKVDPKIASEAAHLESSEDSVLLPPPPVDVTSLARAEYQEAEQAFFQRDWPAAERALNASWNHQHNHITLYDLAAVHIWQKRYREAELDMIHYFSVSPPALQDRNNAAAKARFRRIAQLQGRGGRPGRASAKNAIALIRGGNYNVLPELDEALNETLDLSLFYWIVAAEYHSAKASSVSAGYPRSRHFMPSGGLDNLRRMLTVYFNGADELGEQVNACRLLEEINSDYRRSLFLEKLQAERQATRGVR